MISHTTTQPWFPRGDQMDYKKCDDCGRDIEYTQSYYDTDKNRCTLQNSMNFITGMQLNNIHKVFCFDCYLEHKKAEGLNDWRY